MISHSHECEKVPLSFRWQRSSSWQIGVSISDLEHNFDFGMFLFSVFTDRQHVQVPFATEKRQL